MSANENTVDLAMLAVLNTPIEDPIIFKWARQKLGENGEKVEKFKQVYMEKKKQKSTAHLLNLIALVGVGGIHRFYLGDIGLGLAHLFTLGFCWVGTVTDIIAINQRVNRANVNIAMQTLEIIRSMD